MDYELLTNGNVKIGQKAPDFEANIFRKKTTKLEVADGITVVPTMNDTITEDSS